MRGKEGTYTSLFSCFQINFIRADAEAADAKKVRGGSQNISSDMCVTPAHDIYQNLVVSCGEIGPVADGVSATPFVKD